LILQPYTKSRTGFVFTSDRFGTVVSTAGNGVDALSVSGGDTGDRIHTTPFQFTKTNTTGAKGTRSSYEVFQRRAYSISTSGVISSNTIVPNPGESYNDFLTEATDIAKSKMYDKLSSNLNFIVDAVEGGKTIHMIRDTLKFKTLFADFFKNLVVPKRNFKRGRSRGISPSQVRIDYATAKWLEYRYGWMPLYLSIYGAMKELQKSFRTDNALVVRSQGKVEKIFTTKTGDGSYNNPVLVTTTKTSARALYLMFFCVPPGVSLSDWTSLNPVGIAWELTPLSFVVDWFLNVGRYLDELETYIKFATSFRFGQLTLSGLTETILTTDGVSDMGFTYFINGDLSGGTGINSLHTVSKYRQSHLNRLVSGFPFPSLPRFNANLNGNRIIDAASLLQQILVRGLR